MDIDKVRSDWRARGFSCEVWSDPPGQIWKDYVHQTDELAMLIEGEVEFIIDGQSQKPKIGEELFIPAQSVHSVINIGTSRNRWLYGYKSDH